MRFFLLFLFLSSAAFAEKIPVPIQKNLDSYNLIAKSSVKFLGFKRYDIELWSNGKKFSYETKFALHFKYNMNFTKEILAEVAVDNIEDFQDLKWSERRQYRATLDEVFVNIKKGDEVTALFDPQNGVTFFHKNQKTGEISSLKFARYFVDIWLDEKGAYPKIAKKLLGQSNEKNS